MEGKFPGEFASGCLRLGRLQVIFTRCFPSARCGPNFVHLGSGCHVPCRHPAHLTNRACRICCGKRVEGINNRVLPGQTQGQPNAGVAFCRAPGGCHRQVVGASGHKQDQAAAQILHCAHPTLHWHKCLLPPSSQAVVSVQEEVRLGSKQGGRLQKEIWEQRRG